MGIFLLRLVFLGLLILPLNFVAQATTNSADPGSETLIAAQIENQKAQAEYYKKQTSSKSFLQSLEQVLASSIGTFIGAGLALFGVRWSSNKQWELEQRKWNRAQEDDAAKSITAAAVNVSEKFAAEIQEIVWLTWIGKYEPETMQNDMIESYNQAMKKLMTEDVVAQAALAAVDRELQADIRKFAKKIFALDHKLSSFTTKFLRTKDNGARVEVAMQIGTFYDYAYDLFEMFPGEIGAILEKRQERNRSAES